MTAPFCLISYCNFCIRKLAGKAALIAGASRRIGKAAKDGVKVVVDGHRLESPRTIFTAAQEGMANVNLFFKFSSSNENVF